MFIHRLLWCSLWFVLHFLPIVWDAEFWVSTVHLCLIELFCGFLVIVVKYDKRPIISFFAGVPYSEHSSFTELREFVQVWSWNINLFLYSAIDILDNLLWYYLQFAQLIYIQHHFLHLFVPSQLLRPDKIIPTVNVGNATNRDKMHSYFREWLKGWCPSRGWQMKFTISSHFYVTLDHVIKDSFIHVFHHNDWIRHLTLEVPLSTVRWACHINDHSSYSKKYTSWLQMVLPDYADKAQSIF